MIGVQRGIHDTYHSRPPLLKRVYYMYTILFRHNGKIVNQQNIFNDEVTLFFFLVITCLRSEIGYRFIEQIQNSGIQFLYPYF